MSGLYLDGGGPGEREAFLPRMHRQSGFAGSLDEYRARLETLDVHPYRTRAVRDLVLRDETAAATAALRLTAIPSLHRNREVWIGGISHLVAREASGTEEALSRIVGMTLALLGDEDVDGAVIFADGHPGYLRDLGFEVIAGEGIDVELAEMAGPAAPGLAIRASVRADGPELRRIHQRSGDGEPLWLQRDAERWDYLLRAAMMRSPEDDPAALLRLTCMSAGRVVGYAIAAPRGLVLDLLDLGLEEPDEMWLAAVLDSLSAAGVKRGCARLRTPVLPGAVGRLLRARFRPTPLQDGLLLAAFLGKRFDPGIVIEHCGGYAALERS